jgi:hypothetical protein
MHTTKINDTAFIHNGDFSGDIKIRCSRGADEITLPFADIKAIVARYVIGERVSRLEQASDDEILGLRATEGKE